MCCGLFCFQADLTNCSNFQRNCVGVWHLKEWGEKKNVMEKVEFFSRIWKDIFLPPSPKESVSGALLGWCLLTGGRRLLCAQSQYCRREESADGGARFAWLGSPVGEEGSDQLSLHQEMLQGTIGNICKDIMGHERFKAGKHRACYRLVIYPGGRQVLYSL